MTINGWTESAEQIEARKRRILGMPKPNIIKRIMHSAAQGMDALFNVPMTLGFWRALVWVMAIALVIQIALTAAGWLLLKAAGG